MCREVTETLDRRYPCLTRTIEWRSRTGEGEKGNGKYLVYSLRTSWQKSDQRGAGHLGTAIRGIGSLGIAPYVQITCHAVETEAGERGEGWSWKRS
jgi:hypothetical protein